MHRFPIRAYDKVTLERMSQPLLANQPEAVPWEWFDSQNYVDNTTTSLTYFTTVQGNPHDGNLKSAGQLPDPEFFQIFGIMFDIIAGVFNKVAATVAGVMEDTAQLMLASRSLAVLTVSSKEYRRSPLSLFHASGALNAYIAGTFTATAGNEFAQWGPVDGGLYVGGAIVIPPKQAFDLTVTWRAAVDTTADRQTRAILQGVRFRQVR